MTFKKCDVKRLRRGSNPQPLVPKTNALPLRHAVSPVDYCECTNSCTMYRSAPGFEPGTSCTRSRNHTSRPSGRSSYHFSHIYKSRSVTLSLIIIKHFLLAAKLKENKCLLSIYIISSHPILPSENYPCPYLIQHIYNGTYILKFIQ